ncbi:molecular chaperone DnaJ [Alteromonas sp. ASW11-19]|uniref:Molecular chaperone DnaJ n=1 Tax=Alteromonas salexigens TaxID=2982530 RepID=A0ABT2VNT1_9ALTE|nr:DNA-J related domain-containing protein [Alteromonas salexigens]MCU7554754.1 molecular chaperone DnaJ [Alteromonas salexigens]
MTAEPTQPVSPLIAILADWQDWFRDGTTEYDVIARLQRPPLEFFPSDALRDPLRLFQTHFALYNALYQLRDEWWQQQTGELDIAGTRIVLKPYTAGEAGLLKPDPLRAFYLDWSHFDQTGEADVEALLDSFWRNMAGERTANSVGAESVAQAKQQLALPEDEVLSLVELKRQYRKRLHVCHPDKGGSAAETKAIVSAYSVLYTQLVD